jgi:hypothetical protein
MAKTNSKLEARSRKAKDSHKSNSSKIRKRNKRGKYQPENKRSSNSEPTAEKPQIFGWVIPDDFMVNDPKRQNVFIGECAQDTLENVRAGLVLIQALIGNDKSDVTLSSESKHGLCLVIDNLMWALYIERELERGNV